MFLGSYGLSNLPTLVIGFNVACQIYDKAGLDKFSAFLDWFNKRHLVGFTSSWTLPFLEQVDFDEKAALDFFFSELEVYVSENSRTIPV